MSAVLIVDDESAIRTVLARWLVAAGYDIREAADAESALDELAHAEGRREGPTARIDADTSYILTELPTFPLEPTNVRITATGKGPVPLTLRCPPALAGHLVGLRVTPASVLRAAGGGDQPASDRRGAGRAVSGA